MKKVIAWAFIATLLLPACKQSESEKNEHVFDFVLKTPFKEYTISSPAELKTWFEKVLKDGTQLEFAEIRYSEEAKIHYLYGKGKTKGGQMTTLGMVVDRLVSERSGNTVTYVIGEAQSGSKWKECLHSCSAGMMNPCTTCDLTIHTECKGISCTCKTQDGACDGSVRIVYHDD
jgi:hypothetical protein